MTRRLLLATVIAAVLTGSAVPSVRADGTPVRSGTIVGGGGVEFYDQDPAAENPLEHSGCEYALDCRAWLHSGCNPALAGQDPVLTTSIVDVANLADGTTPRSLEMRAPSIPPWGLYPGTVIQFWLRDCTELPNTKLHSLGEDATSCEGYVGGGFGSCTFHIPAGATWMTLSGYATTVALSWSLV